MLVVEEAQKQILQRCEPLPVKRLPLSEQLLGLVLAEDVASDLDLPPFDKSLMDGYAVQVASLGGAGPASLLVVEEVLAGQTPTVEVGPGQATRIMTGAPIPGGADAVVMVERTKLVAKDTVLIDDSARAGQNILPRGREMRQGETILHAGQVIRPQELGLLAAVGCAQVAVHPPASVAVLPTGDEIVDFAQKPGPGQIRNSNGPMLLGQVQRAGGEAHFLGIARDTVEDLRERIRRGLEHDVLILSGGVSAGKVDLVPKVLTELGVETHFHKVQMKPGRPMLFGTRPRNGQMGETLVFGLPGNPVSSLVCFELFVRPALRRLKGLEAGPVFVQAELARDYAYRTDRPTYHPAKLSTQQGRWMFEAVPWFGSPDLRGVLDGNCFVLFPAGDHQHRQGTTFPVLVTESVT